MKATKKILAAFLSLAMILGSIYWVNQEGSEAKAEATANTDMLEVKVQIATDDSNVIRFISSVDSLEYREVGFEVTPNGETTKTYTTKTVYERIDSEEEGVEYTFSPKVVDTSSEYFVTAKLRATAGVDYAVRAFVTTLEGEKVYGATRCVAVEDGKSTSTLNLTYTATTAPTVGSTIDVTYGASSTATTAEVIYVYGNDVTVRVSVNPTTLPSATKFTFGTTGSTIYRNYYTTHVVVEGDTTQINADTTWYDVDTSATEFVIATSADLYGLAAISNAKEKFVSDTIYLVSDIAINPTTDGVTAKEWAAASAKPSDVYAWTPIANGGYYTYFGGTFDGQMHTISGLYFDSTGVTAEKGILFGVSQAGSAIKNFYLKESYLNSTSDKNGSVVGAVNGTLDTVYSNAVVKVKNAGFTGGIAGVASDNNAKIQNCWFDGTLNVSEWYGRYAGGILGAVVAYGNAEREYYLENNLFTGVITNQAYNTPNSTGGIIGGNYNTVPKKIHVINCLSAGTITIEYASATGVGSIYGQIASGTVDMINAYGTNDCYSVMTNLGSATLNGVNAGENIGLTNEALYGVAGYQKTLLDFEETWVAREGNVPALKAFEDVITEKIVDISGVSQNNWLYSEVNTYGISNATALKGFSDMAETEMFAWKTVCLLDDIKVNEVEEGTLDAWKAGTGTLPESWKPIGRNSTYGFRGTFDGQMHTISGIYLKEMTTNSDRSIGYGLFGKTGINSTIKNLYLMDSYMEVYDPNGNANANGYVASLGSIVGSKGVGAIQNVYSNATLVSDRSYVGGIAGVAHGNNTDLDTSISNCWYDGNIELRTSHGRFAGGIVGYAIEAVTYNNILFTGNISYQMAYSAYFNGTAGLIGLTSEVYDQTITVQNSISAGTLTKGTNAVTTGLGSIIGVVALGSAQIENVYGSTDFWQDAYNTGISTAHTGTVTGTATTCAEAELYGDLATTNASALDYTNTWVTREGDVPALKVFTKVIGQ